MRALGTHGNVERTIRAVEYHETLIRRCWNVFLRGCQSGTCPDLTVVRRMNRSRGELQRKIIDNEQRYARARLTISDQLTEGCGERLIFDRLHVHEREIWTDARILHAREMMPVREAAVTLATAITRACEAETVGTLAGEEAHALDAEVDRTSDRLGLDRTTRALSWWVIDGQVPPDALRLLEGDVRRIAEI